VTLEKIIEIADQAYGDGLVQAAFDFRPHHNADTLALFIVRELLEVYEPEATDIEQLREGQRVMLTAYDEIGAVVDAFENAIAQAKKEASCNQSA